MISTVAGTDRADAPTGPRVEYARRLEAARTARAGHERLEAVYGNGKVIFVLVGVILLYPVFGLGLVSPYWLVALVLGFFASALLHERINRSINRELRVAKLYEQGLARLEDRWAGAGHTGERFLEPDHPYALDLDLFGQGSLYERLCTARTEIGAARLAGWLKAPAEPATIRARQEAVDDLRPRLTLREHLGLGGSGEHVDLEALVAWGRSPRLMPAPWTRWIAVVCSICTISTLILWLGQEIRVTPFVAAAAVQIGYALWLKEKVMQVIAPIDRRAHDLGLFAGILALIEREEFSASHLVKLQEALERKGRQPSGEIARLRRIVNWLDCTHNPYFGMISPIALFKTQLAYAFETWRALSGPGIAAWLEAVGEFEALASLSAHAYENPDDPFPEIVEGDAVFEAEQIGHPLLTKGIRNDVRLGGELRVLVISGSNMSGKSTLLRTVGVNTVLALAGAPVKAARLRLAPFAIGATLRIQDSLQAGKSRFYAEITRIRQLVDLTKGPLPLLFLLDEILHGTNSHDRKIGAEAIVRALVEANALGLVTTHDLALTHVAEQLAPRAINMHFADTFENGQIVFDYRLKPGVVQHSNALALMRAVGLDV